MNTHRGTSGDGRGEHAQTGRNGDCAAAREVEAGGVTVGSGGTGGVGVTVGGGVTGGAQISAAVRTILCTWELVTAIYPRGTADHTTKTYLHRAPGSPTYSLIRMVQGKLISHTYLTGVELHALGNVA